jgi:hypothetical protein
VSKPTLDTLIASARGDEPTAEQLHRLEQRLAPLLPPGGGGGHGGHGGAGAGGGGLALKWIAAGVVAVGGTAAVHHVVTRTASPPSRPQLVEAARPSPPDAAPPPDAPPPVVAVRTPASRPHAQRDSLAEEVALLDRARTALGAGDAQSALATCDAHAQQFSRGVLREERERIAIEALVILDRRTEAEARAQRFDRAFPNSVQSERIHALLHGR